MNKILRVIDVNVNRSAEGLRVLEDYARFIKKDIEIVSETREMRHYIRKICLDSRVMYRDSISDIGLEISASNNLDDKNNLKQLITANTCRVSESLRVIEEYLKCLNLNLLSKSVEKKRFEFYEIEKQLLQEFIVSGLYAVTSHGSEEIILKQVKMLIRNNVRWIQYRDKKRTGAELEKIACEIMKEIKGTNSKLIINDYPYLARKINAHGVHVGQGDMSIKKIRNICPNMLIGISTHNEIQLKTAIGYQPDYIAVGPMYETFSKENVEYCEGPSYAKFAREATTLPLVAIGGIKDFNINKLIEIGIDAFAMITAVQEEKMVRKLQKIIGGN
ncbi:MAG: thiamine phosphate synthase [Alkaliphilus sp.]